jgi:hypothetical protein
MIAEQIKKALHNGSWKDAAGVVKQINENRVSLQDLFNIGALNKQITERIEIPDDFVVDRVVKENIKVLSLQDYFPLSQYQRILLQYLKNSDIPFKELIDIISSDKQIVEKIDLPDDYIVDRVIKENINIHSLRDCFSVIQFQRILQKYEEFLAIKINAEKKKLYNNINNGLYQNHEIRELVHNNTLTRNDILNNTHINIHVLAEIMGDPVEPMLPPPLPPTNSDVLLLENRTDVFTFGVVGSGKSLFLGAVFAYAHSQGLYRTEMADKAATQYTDFLIRAINNGRPIVGTAIDYALYLPVTFKNKEEERVKKGFLGKAVWKQKFHPFNFIEMSGEHFQDIYSADNIFKWLKEYLFESQNRKIFFFTIDFFIHHTNSEDQLEASQSAQFQNVLNFLEQNELLGDTIAICLLITKWDLCPNPSKEAAINFLENNYKNLYETCKDKARSNKHLDFKIFTFSIGDVRSSNSYIYNPSQSEGIFDWLCDTSYYELRD